MSRWSEEGVSDAGSGERGAGSAGISCIIGSPRYEMVDWADGMGVGWSSVPGEAETRTWRGEMIWVE